MLFIQNFFAYNKNYRKIQKLIKIVTEQFKLLESVYLNECLPQRNIVSLKTMSINLFLLLILIYRAVHLPLLQIFKSITIIIVYFMSNLFKSGRVYCFNFVYPFFVFDRFIEIPPIILIEIAST